MPHSPGRSEDRHADVPARWTQGALSAVALALLCTFMGMTSAQGQTPTYTFREIHFALPEQGSGGSPIGISDNGFISGWAKGSAIPPPGANWLPSIWSIRADGTDLREILPGAQASDMNAAGRIVGDMYVQIQNPPVFTGTVFHAIAINADGSGFEDLQQAYYGADWLYSQAFLINEEGQILIGGYHYDHLSGGDSFVTGYPHWPYGGGPGPGCAGDLGGPWLVGVGAGYDYLCVMRADATGPRPRWFPFYNLDSSVSVNSFGQVLINGYIDASSTFGAAVVSADDGTVVTSLIPPYGVFYGLKIKDTGLIAGCVSLDPSLLTWRPALFNADGTGFIDLGGGPAVGCAKDVNAAGQVLILEPVSGGRIWVASPLLTTLTATPDHVWANGHEATTLTATLADLSGQPITDTDVQLSANPATGVTITDTSDRPARTVRTDSTGTARFKVRSTEVADQSAVIFTAEATVPGQSPLTSSTNVRFLRHKIVVQFVGIDTALNCSCGECTSAEPSGSLHPSDRFDEMRSILYQRGFTLHDFLWYSYNGGNIDEQFGTSLSCDDTMVMWLAATYKCSDTAKSYVQDGIPNLRKLIAGFGGANPNTDLYLVGHSQGGFIAFQELGFLSQLPSKTAIKALITLDSPLGGAPQSEVKVAKRFTCWKGPANEELAYEYRTASDHKAQGTTAELFCRRLGLNFCPDVELFDSNATAVEKAGARGVQVFTWGSTDDAVYRPSACSGAIETVSCVGLEHLFDGLRDNTSTQIVSGAGGSLQALGGSVPDPGVIACKPVISSCITNSHGQVIDVQGPAIESIIGRQIE